MNVKELKRILEIMGISDNLISEASPIGDFSKDLLKILSKTTDNAGRIVTKLGDEIISLPMYNRILNALDRNDLNQLLDIDKIKLGRAMASMEETQDVIESFYRQTLSKVLSRLDISEKTFYQKLVQKKSQPQFEDLTWEQFLMGEGGGTPFFKDENGNPDLLKINALSQKIRKRANEFENSSSTNPFKTEVRPMIPQNIASKYLSAEEITKFNKILDDRNVTFWTDFTQVYKKNLNQLKTEIFELSKGFLDKYKGDNDPKILNAYSVAISRKLDLMSVKNKEEMLNFLKEEKIPSEILEKLGKSDEDFFKIFRELRSDEYQGAWVNIKSATMSFLKDIGKILPDIYKTNGKVLLDIKRSSVQFFYTAQWASLSNLWRRAIKMSPGTSKTKLMKYLMTATITSWMGYLVGKVVLGLLLFGRDVFYATYNATVSWINSTFNQNLSLISTKNPIEGVDATQTAILSLLLNYGFDGFKEGASKTGIKELVSMIPGIGSLQSFAKAPFSKIIETSINLPFGANTQMIGIVDWPGQVYKWMTGSDMKTDEQTVLNQTSSDIPSQSTVDTSKQSTVDTSKQSTADTSKQSTVDTSRKSPQNTLNSRKVDTSSYNIPFK